MWSEKIHWRFDVVVWTISRVHSPFRKTSLRPQSVDFKRQLLPWHIKEFKGRESPLVVWVHVLFLEALRFRQRKKPVRFIFTVGNELW